MIFGEGILTFVWRSKGGAGTLGRAHAPHRVAVVPIIGILRIHTARIDVQIVHSRRCRVTRRPEVAVETLIVGNPGVEVAGKRSTEKYRNMG